MLDKSQFWILTVLAAIAAVCTLANMVLFQHTRKLQSAVSERQQYIQQSIQLETLYREMAKALADLSIRNQDPQLKELLGSHGITITPRSGAPTADPSGPDAKTPK